MINQVVIDTLKSVVEYLKVNVTYNSGSTKPYDYKGLLRYRDAVLTIESLGLFPETVKEIKTTSLFTERYKYDTQSLSSSEDPFVKNLSNALYFKSLGVIEIYDQNFNNDTSDALLFKYPQINDFPELEKFAKELNHAVQIPLHVISGNENDLDILKIEEGSIVLTVSFSAGLLIITKLIDLAFRYKSKWEEAKRNIEYSRSLQLDNDLKETFVSAINDQVKLFLQTESELLSKELIENVDNEKIEIVKNSIITFNSLLNKGLSVQPSISAPAEIKDSFERFNTLNLNEQKQIEEPKSDS
ncbi:hypothetical protein ACFSR6_12170 [Pedobacter vanadiisoli]|uniref:Uncharacterized protein n=1 Tax=Pedobacter vanadiisoli TaxID=1761975 RepID=A0ABW5ML59_9SPHI